MAAGPFDTPCLRGAVLLYLDLLRRWARCSEKVAPSTGMLQHALTQQLGGAGRVAVSGKALHECSETGPTSYI